MGLIERLERLGRLAEDSVLVLMLTAMIVLASLQILLRNGFDTGFIWADELLRIMVLWLALVGAVAASRANRQISIDVLSRLLPARPKSFVDAIVDAFTALVCGLLAWHSWRFVSEAREFGDTVLSNLPAWWFQIILPIGFGLMAWRYGLFALANLVRGIRGTAAAQESIT